MALLGAVRVRDPELHGARPDEPLGEQRAVGVERLAGRTRGAPDDLRAVRREERAAVVTGRVGQAAHVAAVGVHAVEVEIAVAHSYNFV